MTDEIANEMVEELRRLIEQRLESDEALGAELVRRAQELETTKRRRKSWDDTKREILGHFG